MSRSRASLLAALALLVPLAACTDNDPDTGASGPITVSSTDDACTLSTTEVPSGNLVFRVTNDGSKVTEFYLLGSDGLSVVAVALGIFGIAIVTAPALGPILGGYLVDLGLWRWIFFVNIPIGLVGIGLGIWWLRTHRPQEVTA